MKNNYLRTFQRQPNPEFTNNLYQHLTHIPSKEVAPRSSPLTPHLSSPIPRRLRPAWVLATVLLMLSVMAMVPSVRARFKEIVQRIGGLTILMTDQYPGSEDARIVPDDVMTLATARARIDYELHLPTWAPEGMTLLENEVRGSNIRHSQLTLRWTDENAKGRAFSLTVADALPDVNYVVGPDSVTEIMINDMPATLIRGAWYNNSKTWNYDISRSLRWQMNGLEYQLHTGNATLGGLSEKELIQVAESIAPP